MTQLTRVAAASVTQKACQTPAGPHSRLNTKASGRMTAAYRSSEMTSEGTPSPSPSSAPQEMTDTDEMMKPALIILSALSPVLIASVSLANSDVSQSADLDGFQDRDQVAAYAQAPLQWAVAAGIVNGTNADTLSPNGSASRAQTAVMLMRFCDFTSL